jgi:serine/threonine protein phosphatase PrpC
MPEQATGLKASAGFYSSAGPREHNEDFAGAVFGSELPVPRSDVVAVIADGIGGAKGGRVAAETAVRGFLDGFCDLPESIEVQRAAARIVNALNSWIYAQGRHDPKLAGMGCTLTGLVLRGRVAHILHVGDTRAYRFSGERLVCLTSDHVGRVGAVSGLTRALGAEPEVRLDYSTLPVSLHDRFLLVSDGVHGTLSEADIADRLRERSAPDDTARAIVAAALKYGSGDNCTALVLDVVRLPQKTARAPRIELPMIPTPIGGETVDGFLLRTQISDGRYTRLFAATDEIDGGEVAVKFPKPHAADAELLRTAFAREAWVAEAVENPWLVRILDVSPGRQTCLYTAMPLYQGERLDVRLARMPAVGLEEGRNIAIKLARAATSLHRAGIVHRDIKPDNVILERDGALKLLDLGVAKIRGREDWLAAGDVPGTIAYMAPEMFAGETGNEQTDLYALGVTMFRAFTGEYPYGNADAVSPPRREKAANLLLLRPDLPAWLQSTLNRAIALEPAERFQDMMEFAVEMESGPRRAAPMPRGPRTLYERAPLQFWQGVAALLAFALLLALMRH